MGSVQEHYQNLLASHYTWMSGGFEQKLPENRQFFQSILSEHPLHAKALDLGCGSGFQTLALSSLGFDVVAIDTSEELIDELRSRSMGQAVTAVVGDFLDSNLYAKFGPFDLAVCMGDTLVHLPSAHDVKACINAMHTHLCPGGKIVLSFRDLTAELKGIDRAIPVKLDEDRLMSTFLEYEPTHIVVNDMIFIRDAGSWVMRKSAYRKLRLAPQTVVEILSQAGFGSIQQQTTNRGFSILIATA